MRSWLGNKKRPILVAAFALLAAIVAIFVQTAPSQAVQAPTLVTAPSISANQISFGYAESKVITVTPGTWTDSPTSVTEQWYRCTSTLAAGPTDPTNCQIITGDTGLIHTITASDVGFYLMVKETATNSQGSSYTYSATTTKIARSHVFASAAQGMCYINAGKVFCAGGSGTTFSSGSLWANAGTGYLGRDSANWLGPVATYEGTVLSDVVSLEGSRAHMCALTRTGAIYCTGMNGYGVLGDGVAGGQRTWFTQMKASSSTFVTGAVDIAVGDSTICFSKVDGTAWCNGYGHSNGMLIRPRFYSAAELLSLV